MMEKLAILQCTCCGANAAERKITKATDGRGSGSISLYKCFKCNCIFLGEYTPVYNPILYDYYGRFNDLDEDSVYDELTAISYSNVLKDLISISNGKRILDVGCGKGDFVRAAKKNGWLIKGIELSDSAVKIARKFDLDVELKDFQSEEIPCNFYNVITMFEVIEHLPDPVGFLKRAESVVCRNGLIYLTTPNYNSLDRRILSYRWNAIHREHLSYFTPETMRSMILNNTGLEILYIKTRNISLEIFRKLIFLQSALEPMNLDCAFQRKTSRVRYVIQKFALLRLMKLFINGILNMIGMGNTMIVLLRRS